MRTPTDLDGQLHCVLDDLQVIIWVADDQLTRLRFLNRRAAPLLGHQLDRLCAQTPALSSLLPPEDWRRLVEACHTALATHRSQLLEHRMLDAQQQVHWFLTELRPLDASAGPGCELAGVMVDVTADHLASQELERIRQRYAEVVDSVEGIVWELDPSTFQFLFISKAAERLLGYPTARWLEEPGFWQQHLHPADREWAMDFCRARFAEGRDHDLEYRMIAASGAVIWIRDVVTVIKHEGQPSRMRGVMLDITVQKKAQEQLEQSRRRSTLLAEASRVLATSLGEQPILQKVARLLVPDFADWCALYLMEGGWLRPVAFAHAEPAKEQWAREFFQHPLALEQLSTPLESVLRESLSVIRSREPLAPVPPPREPEDPGFLRELGLQCSFLVPLRTRREPFGALAVGGSLQCIQDQPLVEDLARRCAVAIENARLFHEVAEAIHRKEEARALLDTLLRTAPVGLAFLDPRLRLVTINESLSAITGVSPEHHLGKRLREALPGLQPPLEPLLRRVLSTGQPLVEVALTASRAGSGPPRHWVGSFYPVHSSEREVLGVGCVMVDMTERKQVAEERLQLLRKAQAALRIREDFLSIASHELKTPLTPLSLRLRMIEHALERGEPVDPRWVSKALSHLAHLTALINDLLDVSRIEAGQWKLEREEVSLRKLVERVVDEFQLANPERRLVLEQSGEELTVEADPSRLEQVITNLVDNAIKYSPGGGLIHIQLVTRGADALLSVKDQGIGIPVEQQEKLFERFFRARNAPARQFGGLGLGLYISRRIVEAHGGYMGVQSQQGQGSTFYVRLPLAARAACTALPPAPA